MIETLNALYQETHACLNDLRNHTKATQNRLDTEFSHLEPQALEEVRAFLAQSIKQEEAFEEILAEIPRLCSAMGLPVPAPPPTHIGYEAAYKQIEELRTRLRKTRSIYEAEINDLQARVDEMENCFEKAILIERIKQSKKRNYGGLQELEKLITRMDLSARQEEKQMKQKQRQIIRSFTFPSSSK